MKKIKLLLLIFIPLMGVGQISDTMFIGGGKSDTAYRYYKTESDSFLIEYVHGGMYMEPAVGRMICDIDSTISDSVRKVNPFAGMINCREDTAYYNADRHYFSSVKVYVICNGKKTPLGKEMFGYYVPHGCFEDEPSSWIRRAKEGK